MRALPHASPTQRAVFSPTLLYALLLLCVTSGFFFQKKDLYCFIPLFLHGKYQVLCCLCPDVGSEGCEDVKAPLYSIIFNHDPCDVETAHLIGCYTEKNRGV